MACLAPSLAVALSATLLAQAGATGPRRGPADPVRVGLYGSFSLPNNGPAMRDGARIAADAINEAGGVLGRPLVLVEADDRGSPGEGLRAARDLVERKGVVALVGPSLTIVADATSSFVNERRVPEIVAGATGNAVNELLEAGEDSYVFRFSLADRIQAVMIVREAIEVRGRRRPAIVYETTRFGEQGRDRLLEALRRRGVEPARVVALAPNGDDAAACVEVARAAGADVLLTYAVSGPAARIVRALEGIRWRVDLIGSWALSHEGFLRSAGPFADGATMPQSFIDSEAAGEEAARFRARWRARFGTPIWAASAAAQGYDALHLLARAFEQAGATDGPSVKAALESLRRPYDGVTGRHWKPWSSTDHEGIKRGGVLMGVIRGGRVVALPPR